MKVKASHVIGGLFVVGLLIYFLTRREVHGTVTALETEATVSPGPRNENFTGSVSFGTELQGS